MIRINNHLGLDIQMILIYQGKFFTFHQECVCYWYKWGSFFRGLGMYFVGGGEGEGEGSVFDEKCHDITQCVHFW